MRTTLDVESDVLDAARALAVARRVSVGAALSELARRGMEARTPILIQSGFPVFQIAPGTPAFSLDDVSSAMESEDLETGHHIIGPRHR